MILYTEVRVCQWRVVVAGLKSNLQNEVLRFTRVRE